MVREAEKAEWKLIMGVLQFPGKKTIDEFMKEQQLISEQLTTEWETKHVHKQKLRGFSVLIENTQE